ncbi:hypothetical protein CEXT_50701 [Caerostris extrusa]|uniref:Uncharacterized protein n=1 Tax=Caerostris extrusa TaxID=172846 RepID=A0AAV4UP29_CAEEX|nr:hypothetical protein CEXT_50701 [Caerostris extrusa]
MFFTLHGRHIRNVTGKPKRGLDVLMCQSLHPSFLALLPFFHRPERSDSSRQQLDTARSTAEAYRVKKNAFVVFPIQSGTLELVKV